MSRAVGGAPRCAPACFVGDFDGSLDLTCVSGNAFFIAKRAFARRCAGPATSLDGIAQRARDDARGIVRAAKLVARAAAL